MAYLRGMAQPSKFTEMTSYWSLILFLLQFPSGISHFSTLFYIATDAGCFPAQQQHRAQLSVVLRWEGLRHPPEHVWLE